MYSGLCKMLSELFFINDNHLNNLAGYLGGSITLQCVSKLKVNICVIHRLFFIRLAFFVPLFLASIQVCASQFVDPDYELQRQQQQLQDIRQKQEQAAHVLSSDKTGARSKLLPDTESPCFLINKINLKGMLPEFGALDIDLSGEDGADSPIVRCIGVKAIQMLTERVQNALIAKGYVTSRVTADSQDLTHEELALSVVPERIAHIRYRNSDLVTPALSVLLSFAEGGILNLRHIEQALENFRCVPLADVDIQIEPSSEDGFSNLFFDF
jgi:hemolysin activation/secretion protein